MNSIELIKLLEDVKDCKLEVSSAEVLFLEIDWEKMPTIKAVSINLHHFWQDEDIRSNDAGYRAMQNFELQKLIGHLQNGDWSKANGVSFLEVSGT